MLFLNADTNLIDLAIVVLSYLNYEDTIECVNSILDFNYPIKGIVIVDNNSEKLFIKKVKVILR